MNEKQMNNKSFSEIIVFNKKKYTLTHKIL